MARAVRTGQTGTDENLKLIGDRYCNVAWPGMMPLSDHERGKRVFQLNVDVRGDQVSRQMAKDVTLITYMPSCRPPLVRCESLLENVHHSLYRACDVTHEAAHIRIICRSVMLLF